METKRIKTSNEFVLKKVKPMQLFFNKALEYLILRIQYLL
jgi:hypothetical protein